MKGIVMVVLFLGTAGCASNRGFDPGRLQGESTGARRAAAEEGIQKAHVLEPQFNTRGALLRQAESWKKGMPFPAELLEYRDAHQDGASFHLDTDTIPVFSKIVNYPLLLEIALSPGLDNRISDCAVLRALHLVGPTRFFSDVKAVHARSPGLLGEEKQRILEKSSELKHVLVEGISIRKDAMSTERADGLFADISEDIKRGDSWEAVFKRYVCDCSRPVADPAPRDLGYAPAPEKRTTSVSSCPGNFGEFILSRENSSDSPLRHAEVPEEHMYPLLQAEAGDLLLLDDNAGARRILYHVREVYIP